jgi:ectoine hydroxylase
MREDLYPTRRRPEPSISARRDPVVYAQGITARPIAPDQIAFYEANGFLVLENVLSAEEIAVLKAQGEAMRDGRIPAAPATIISEPGKSGASAVRSIFAIHQQSDAFGALCRDARLADIARFLLDDEVYIHQSRLNYKPAFRGKDFYWHSDFETWHAEDGMPRMRALSMSVMLTDNHPQSGPTMFVPKSHKSFIACVGETPDDHYKSSLKKQEYGVPDDASLKRIVEEGGLVGPAPKAGSVVIFDCNTMHGSNSNITPLERMNAFFVFNAWSNRLGQPFAAAKERPEFIAHREVASPLPRLGQARARAS